MATLSTQNMEEAMAPEAALLAHGVRVMQGRRGGLVGRTFGMLSVSSPRAVSPVWQGCAFRSAYQPCVSVHDFTFSSLHTTYSACQRKETPR